MLQGKPIRSKHKNVFRTLSQFIYKNKFKMNKNLNLDLEPQNYYKKRKCP
jgi:hypothetical protein